MPVVQSYRKTERTGAFQPVNVGADMSLRSQYAVIASGLPDKNGGEVQRAMAVGDINRQKNSLELTKAGMDLTQVGMEQSAKAREYAAKATSMAQQTAGQILAAAGARLTKMQEDYDEAEVLKASNEWHDSVNRYWNDPDNGMKATRQLGNAKGIYGDTSAYLTELSDRVSSRLRTKEQKAAFMQSVANSRLATEETASRYEASEMDKYAKQTTETTLKNAISAVVEDPSTTNFNAQFGRASEAMLFYMRGADDATKQTALNGLKSDLQSAIVESQIQKDPLKAEQYFNAVKEQILPENRIELQNKVERASMPAKAQNLYAMAKGDYAAAMTWIDKNVPEAQQKAYRSEFQLYCSDMDSIKTVTYRKTNEDFAKKYLSRGLSMGDIAGAVKSGALDAAGALTWQNRLEADHDRAVAKAERAAAQAENQRDREAYKNERLFSLSLRHMTPIQQQYAEFAHYYGVTPAMVNKNYSDAMKKADAGKLTFDDVAALQANGLVIPMQAEQLNGRVKGQATVAGKKYDAAMARGRTFLSHLLDKANISNSLIQNALTNYDNLTIGGNYDPKEFTNVALDEAYKTLYPKDVVKSTGLIFKDSTPAGDVFNEVAALRSSAKSKPAAQKLANAKGALNSSGGQKSRKDELHSILFK